MIEKDVLLSIKEKMTQLSKGHKKLAQYVLDYYDEAAFETAATVGKRIGVSESTVVRFANVLGFDGYPEFQKALGKAMRNRLSGVKMLDEQYSHSSQAELVRRVIAYDIENLQKTAENLNPVAFESAADILIAADKVFVLGFGSNISAAFYLSHYLNMARDNIILIDSGSISEIHERVLRLGANDCVVAIDFPQYSHRLQGVVELAYERNARIIAVTDNVHSPVNRYSDCSLIANSSASSEVASVVATMSLMNALAVSVWIRRRGEVSVNIQELDKMLEQYKQTFDTEYTDEENNKYSGEDSENE